MKWFLHAIAVVVTSIWILDKYDARVRTTKPKEPT